MDEFTGSIPRTVPVFPLPCVVLFPRIVLPLHLFEPRYRQMAADALAAGGFIALAQLRAGYEPLYYTLRAPIHPVLCIGQILASERLDDGNYNILLQGVIRARVEREVSSAAYRVATVELLPSGACPEDSQRKLRKRLREALLRDCVLDQAHRARWKKLLGAALEFDALVDFIAADLPFGAEFQQVLLDEADCQVRAEMILRSIQSMADVRRVRHRAAAGTVFDRN